MKSLLIILFSIYSILAFSQQNLVPNPSFEEIISCPVTGNDLYLAAPWTNPVDSTPTSYWQSCLFNGCNSGYYGVPYHSGDFVPAHSGIGYAHIYTLSMYGGVEPREYIQVRLNDSLVKNVSYKISFFVQLAERNAINFATNKLGAYFSKESVNYVRFKYIPQFINTTINLTDKYQWMEIKGTYVAHGGERYITIGNFFREFQSDTIYVGNVSRTIYRVSGYYIDDVYLGADTLSGINNNYQHNQQNEISLYPNPAVSYIELNISEGNEEEYQLTLYNAIGACVNRMEVSKHALIDVSQIPDGIYIAIVEDNKGSIKGRKKIIKNGK